VTFSIGVMTFNNPPGSADEAVKLADDMMYLVKSQGKNATNFSSYPDEYRPDSF
jgi:PleD family two-component response regulator